jgi:hypothetical protein
MRGAIEHNATPVRLIQLCQQFNRSGLVDPMAEQDSEICRPSGRAAAFRQTACGPSKLDVVVKNRQLRQLLQR